MTRVLRAELLRYSIPTLAFLFLVSAIIDGSEVNIWWGRWLVFDYMRASVLFFLVPLVLAGGAMLGRREKRTRAAEVLASTGRPRWQQAAPALTARALTVVVAHLLLVAAAAVLIGLTGSYLGWIGFVSPLADVAILLGAAGFGIALGRLWSSPLLPPLLAVAAFAVQFGSDVGGGFEWSRMQNLTLLPQPNFFDWEGPNARALLARLALGVGFAVAAWLLLVGRYWLLRIAAVVAVAAGAAGLVLIPEPGFYGRYEVTASAQRLVCADGTPQVCVTAVHAVALPEITAEVRRGLAALAKLPDAPQRAVEFRPDAVGNGSSDQWWGTTRTSERGTVPFALQLDSGLHPTKDLAARIVYGGGTYWNGCTPGNEVALGAAGAWLLGTDELLLSDDTYLDNSRSQDKIRATVRTLRALPTEEQLKRVTALRDAANRCETDLLPLLVAP
jgi:hypothetical protein